MTYDRSHVDPGWQGGGSGAWRAGSADSGPQLDTDWDARIDPNEYARSRREPQMPSGREGGGDAARTAVMVALQMVRMSFGAAWKMFTFFIRVIMR